MLHACVQRFYVMGNVGKILGTKRPEAAKKKTEKTYMVDRIIALGMGRMEQGRNG